MTNVSPTPSEDREALIAESLAIALAAIEGFGVFEREHLFHTLAEEIANRSSVLAEPVTLEGLVSRYAVIQGKTNG
jgi:hypothetical protein